MVLRPAVPTAVGQVPSERHTKALAFAAESRTQEWSRWLDGRQEDSFQGIWEGASGKPGMPNGRQPITWLQVGGVAAQVATPLSGLFGPSSGIARRASIRG
jgi:hypothetical protein